MRTQLKAAILALSCAWTAAAGGGEFLNPFKGRQQRAEKFEFASKPQVKRRGKGYVISFASKAACDATVAIVDGKGRIVRHLASGVLGKNAPWPFKQGSLTQELHWDGKDDAGKPVDTSRCRVKVSLGLKARLAALMGWSPGEASKPVAVGVGPNGNVYVMDNGGGKAIASQPSSNMRVFDREGRYLRRIFPPMSSVPPERSTGLKWNKTTWGTHVPRRKTAHYSIQLDAHRFGGHSPVATRDGKLVWSAHRWTGRGRNFDGFLLTIDVRDGAMPPGSVVKIDPGCRIMGAGVADLALSPDERRLYFSSPVGGERRDVLGHAVFRMDMKEPGKVSVFLGDRKKAGSDHKHLNKPSCVACDGKGNVYVADTGNHRIQVFKPDGSHLKTLPLKDIRMLAVNRKNGAIYVQQSNGKSKMTLLKLGGLNDPAVKATWGGISTRDFNKWPPMAVDSGEEHAVIWVMKRAGALARLEDRGTSFKELPLGDIGRQAKGWEHWTPWAASGAIVADPRTEQLYARDWSSCWPSGVLRIDGRTGKVLERVMGNGRGGYVETMAVGPQGDIFVRLFRAGAMLARYNPKTRKFVNLKGAKPLKHKKYRGKSKLIAIQFPAAGGARSFQDQMTVAPNGDIYMPVGLHKSYFARLKEMGQEVSSGGKEFHPWAANILKVYDSDGTLKCLSALPGLGASNGIAVGRHGAVYMTIQCHPVGVKLPEGLAPGSSYSGGAWATVVKFNSRFGTYPIGSIEGRWTGQKPGTPLHLWKLDGKPTHHHGGGRGGGGRNVRIKNMLWDYPGASPVRQAGCTCHRSTISLDGFERVFVPATQTCSVNVLDANGNIVARIGAYGNADCRGADSPVPDPKTGELRPRRPGDPKDLKSPLAEPDIAFVGPSYTAVTDEGLYALDRGNERIVRAVLEYHAEETVSVP
jgi:sugar lactone lactonase YvrE